MERLRARELKAYEDYILELHDKFVTKGLANKMATDGPKHDPSFNLTEEDIIYNMTIKGVKENIARINYKYDCLSGPSHYWIGINPYETSEDIDNDKILPLFQKMEQSVRKHKMFNKGYLYCIEAHTEGGIRPHIHLMIKDTQPKQSRVIETLAKVFNCEKHFIQVKKFTDGTLYSEHLKYIKGEKQESKEEFVQNDLKILSHLNIPKYLGTL